MDQGSDWLIYSFFRVVVVFLGWGFGLVFCFQVYCS